MLKERYKSINNFTGNIYEFTFVRGIIFLRELFNDPRLQFYFMIRNSNYVLSNKEDIFVPSREIAEI